MKISDKKLLKLRKGLKGKMNKFAESIDKKPSYVSMVLNGNGPQTEETLEVIRKAIEYRDRISEERKQSIRTLQKAI